MLTQLVLSALIWFRIRPHRDIQISPYFGKYYIATIMLNWGTVESVHRSDSECCVGLKTVVF